MTKVIKTLAIIVIITSFLTISMFGCPTEGVSSSVVFSEDFDSFTGSGFAPSPSVGQLDSHNWVVTGASDNVMDFEDTRTSGDFARGSSTGGVSVGGIYAFDVGSGNVIIGFQPGSSDFTPGSIKLKIVNDVLYTITAIKVDFVFWAYNDQDRANSLTFEYSEEDSGYTEDVSVAQTTIELLDASPTWIPISLSSTISGLDWVPGESIYLRWVTDDAGGSGSRDEFGIDYISVEVVTPVSEFGSTSFIMVPTFILLGILLIKRKKTTFP